MDLLKVRNIKCPFSHDIFWGVRKLINLDLTCPVLYMHSHISLQIVE